MFKKLKKAVIGSEQRLAKPSSQSKEYSVFSNSDTSSGDDSFYLPSAPEPTIREKHDKSDAILNQLVLNLGGDLGIMSLEQDTGYSEQESIFNNTTSATFYTTAIEGVDRTLQADQTGQTIMDKSSSDASTVPSVNNSFESQKDANFSTTKAAVPATKAADPDALEDCLAAFGGLKIKSQTNTPVKPNTTAPTGLPTKLAIDEEQNLRRLSDGSSFLVIDWDSNGQPVEHTLHYLPKTSANAAENKPPADSSHSSLSQNSESNKLLLPCGTKEQLSAMDEYSMIETPKVFAPQEASDLLFSDALDFKKPSLPTKSQNFPTVEECNTPPTLPSTTSTRTASYRSNDKYKDTLPQLVLPTSIASSLDSTPFLTPEAEIADKISDPFEVGNKTVEQLSSVNANTSLSSDSGTINDSQTSVKLSSDSDKSLCKEELKHGEVKETFPDTQNTVTKESLKPTNEAGHNICNHENVEDPKSLKSEESLNSFKDVKNQPENSGTQEISSVKGSYSLDYSKLDSLDCDPFQSTKGLSNFPSDLDFKDTFTQKPAIANNQSPVTVANSGDFLADLLSGMSIKSNAAPKAFPEDEISEDSSISTDRLAGGDNNLTHKNPDATSDVISLKSEGPVGIVSAANNKAPEDGDNSASDTVLPPVNADSGDHSLMKEKTNLSMHKEEKASETEDVPSAKGAYSLDFSQFDDPNYNPFQTSKGLSNSPTEEPPNVPPVVSHAPENGTNAEYLKDKISLADIENKLLSSKDNMPESVHENKEKNQDILSKQDKTASHSTLDNLKAKSNIDSSDQYENAQSTQPCENLKNLEELNSVKQPLMHKSPSSTDSGVLISPEPKPENASEHLTSQTGNEEERPLAPKGDYSIDFSLVDNPNYNPFQTNKGLSNSPTQEAKYLPELPSIQSKEPTFDEDTTIQDLKEDNNFSVIKSNDDKLQFETQNKEEDHKRQLQEGLEAPNDNNQITSSQEIEDSENRSSKTNQPEYEFQSKQITTATEETKNVTLLSEESIDMSSITKEVVQPNLESNLDSEEPLPVKGAYSIDFSKFDDPNFDPFQTKTGIGESMEAQIMEKQKDSLPEPEKSELLPTNEPTPTSEAEASPKQSSKNNSKIKPLVDEPDQVNLEDERIVPKGSYSIDFSKFDDPNFDPFQTKTGVGASMDAQMVEKRDQILPEPEKIEAFPADKEITTSKTSKPSPKQSERKKEIVKKAKPVVEDPDQVNVDDEPIVPKGSYSIDFSKFEDPNFDPFQTKTGIGASMEAQMVETHEEVISESEKCEVLPTVEPTTITISSPEKSAKLNKNSMEVKSVVNEPNPVDDVDPDVPKGAYSIDFSQFDDPNFDPFQTKTGIGTSMEAQIVEKHEKISPEPQKIDAIQVDKELTTSKHSQEIVKNEKPAVNETDSIDADNEPIVPKGSYSIDFSKFDDPNFDPFQTKTGIGASMEAQMIEEQQEILPEPEKIEASPANTKIATSKTSKPSPKQSTEGKQDVKKQKPGEDEQDQINVEDAPIMPKGSYSIDFNKFDDPNFDPFQTKTGVGATMETRMVDKMEEILPEREIIEASPVKEPTPSSKASPKQSAKKRKTVKTTIPVVSEIDQVDGEDAPIMPKGSYSIDFSKFDDPNFDPFQTKTGIGASMEAQMVKDQQEILPEPEKIEDLPVKEPTPIGKASPKQSAKKRKTVKKTIPVVSEMDPVDGEDAPIMPKGSYSIDFSKFDDPNFDPFQTKTGVGASMEVQMVENQQEILPKPEKIESSVDKEPTPSKPSKHSPKQSAKKKKIVKKEKPVKDETGPVNVDDEPIMPKGSYSIDFSKFDDPNFDPFQTKTGIGASMEAQMVDKMEEILPEREIIEALPVKEPTPTSKASPKQSAKKRKTIKKTTPVVSEIDQVDGEDAPIMPKGSYSIDFSKFDDPNFDPFQTKTGIGASMEAQMVKDQQEILPEPEKIEDLPVKEPTPIGKASPKQSAKKKKIVKKAEPVVSEMDQVDGEDAPIVPKGSYSIDFSKFDDPNFDPFQTKTGIGATMEAQMVENQQEILPEPEKIESSVDKKPTPSKPRKHSPKQSAKKKKIVKKTRPVVSEIDQVDGEDAPIMPKGSYSIDFSKFDDPNFDPFQTKTGIGASMEAQMVKDQQEILPEPEKIEDLPVKEPTPIGKASPKQSAKKKKIVKKAEPVVSEIDQVDGEDAPIMPKGSYSIDFSKFDDPNFDPFQTKTGIGASMEAQMVEDVKIPTEHKIGDKELPTKESPRKDKPKQSPTKKKRTVGQETPVLNETDSADVEDAPIMPKGSYSIDFSKFDDPNFDPFQTKTGIGVSVDTNVENESPANAQPVVDSENKVATKPKLSGKKKIAGKKSKPKSILTESEPQNNGDEPIAPKGAYTIDFSQFDDPNYNPFQSSKGLGSSPTKEVKPNFDQDDGDEKENVDTDTTPQNSPLKKKRPIKKKIPGSKSLKLKQEKVSVVPDESAEEIPLPKGDYSIDFSQFDDPNFNPFKVKQSLANDDNVTCENDSAKKSTKLSPKNTLAAPAVAEVKMAENTKQPAKSFPDKGRFSDVASHTSSDSDMFFDAVSNDGRNSRNELDNTLTNDKSLDESIKSECFEVFQPADDVINSAQGLSGWDDLFNKEEAKSNALQESDLRKQSLYVKFDPLVESRKSMHRNMLIESGDAANASLLDFVNNETIKEVDSQTTRRVSHQGGDMTSFEPQYHPAASQLARNMTGESEWNDVVETPTGKLLDLSFSPKEQLEGRTTFSSVKSEVQSTQFSRRLKEVTLEEVEAEHSALLKRKEESLQNILKRKELDRIGSSLQEKNAGMRTALESTEVEHQQVLNEFISAKRMFDDYQRRANELIPIIAAHKKASQDLEKKYKSKMETLRSVREKHFTLKKEANTVKTKLETEVNEVKSAEQRRIQLLEARLKKGQMMLTSLQAQLKDKVTENEELTKICDELFANADK